MPLPKPNNGEKYSKFMDRCMMELTKKDEFKDNKQRAQYSISADQRITENKCGIREFKKCHIILKIKKFF